MKLSEEYFEGFLSRQIIPESLWQLKIIDNEQVIVLSNKNYCNVFWLDLWYYYLVDEYKNQSMVEFIENLDFTRPVYITSDLKLLYAQPIIQQIDYFSQMITNEMVSPMMHQLSTHAVFILFIIGVVIIITIDMVIKKKVNIYQI